MHSIKHDNTTLIWSKGYETVWIQPWGHDSLRVRATYNPNIVDNLWALLPFENSIDKVEILLQDVQSDETNEQIGTICNGKIKATISTYGHIVFFNNQTGKPLLEEMPSPLPDNPHLAARKYKSQTSDLYQISASFKAYQEERFYGLGQHQHGLLNQKGCVIELVQRNTEISIPFTISSRGYGFLWNNPSIGRVELAQNKTRWFAEASSQMDYWITCGDSHAEILNNYVDNTGHSPPLPEWAAGFWQCKLRYTSQDELLSVAREYYYRGLPLSVIVIDALHWSLMGDWRFDPQQWPDPIGMVNELKEMGIKVMVSIWPTVNANSNNFREMRDHGMLVRTERGVPAHTVMIDTQPEGTVYLHLYDATNPNARLFVWDQIKKGYYRHGVKIYWLDANEPEFYPSHHDNLRYALGNGLEVGNIYPLMHQRAFYDGLQAEGETDIITLGRSAWAGSQRFGAAVWSGDIASTYEALRVQVAAGLNIGLSGIPWWTTDIGGFHGGDPQSPEFRELIVRWFQYGAFCPLFRLHGFRKPIGNWTGGPNEIWSFGEEAYEIIKDILLLRERMRPYVMEQMHIAHVRGTPPMRPLFFDFPDDPACISIEDQFMFGPDLLVAPVLYPFARSRSVYLPHGIQWQDAWTGSTLVGGHWYRAKAPLEIIPLYIRDERDLPLQNKKL